MKYKVIIIWIIAFSLLFQTSEAKCATFEADYIPWSGYWWSFIQGGLVTGTGYNGDPAPLEKYDYVTSGTYRSTATNYGLEHYYDPAALHWEGMCFYWAAAAILEKEPIHKGIYKETLFNVGDKKGLLTVLYDGALYTRYNFDNPIDFHSVLEEFILNEKTPIIMDLGSTEEIWNYPVFKYSTDYTQEDNIRHYTTTVYYASDSVHPDFVGTKVITSTYNYYFILDADGNITESGWEKSSIENPPKHASEPFGTKCRNPGIDYETVIEIVNTNDDPLEENDTSEKAAPLTTGGYSLLAIDEDYFSISLKSGDKLNIHVTTDRKDDVILKIYDPDKTLIKETTANESQTIEADTTGTYFLAVIPSDDSNEPFYELFIQQNLSYQGIFPYHPTGTLQTGITLLNPDNSNSRVIITAIDRDGFSQNSYHTDLSSPHLIGMAEEQFGLTSTDGYIRVNSDSPLFGLQSVISKDAVMLGANLIPADKATSELFFPHFTKIWNGWKTYFGFINIGTQTEEIIRQAYDQDGNMVSSDTIELEPGEKREYDSFYTWFLTSESKSMSASTTSKNKSLISYIIFHSPSTGYKGRALIPLPLEKSTELIIPHVASDANWWTGVALMNTGDNDSTVTFTGYDTEGKQIAEFEYQMKAKQNFVKEASTIFSGLTTPGKSIASIKILSQNNQPLCGFLLYGTMDDLQLAGIPLRPATSLPHYVTHVPTTDSWWTGIGLTNAGNVPADISFSLFDSTGNLITGKTYPLNPNQQIVSFVNDLFDNKNISGDYLKIESEQPISGIYLIGSENGKQLMGDGF